MLKEAGIPFHTLVQEPGEFVITFPRSYHGGTQSTSFSLLPLSLYDLTLTSPPSTYPPNQPPPGFNHGFNIAEATNFTTERWVDMGREARVCRCQPYSVHINMDTFEETLAAKHAKDEVGVCGG